MGRKHNKIDIITWVLLIIVLVSNVISIYVSINSRNNIPSIVKSVLDSNIEKIDYNRINNSINSIVDANVKSIDIQKLINESVDKKVNSLNIKNGQNGKDSVSTKTIITEKVIEQKTVIPDKLFMMCNKQTNNLMFKYNKDDNWQYIYNDINNTLLECGDK